MTRDEPEASGDDESGDEASGDDDSEESSGGTTVADVMSENPESVEPGDSIEDAAQKMKEADTGALLVVDGDELKGIVTDRDIVVNAIAEGKREKKVRRLPVVDDDGEPIGIVSLGDLAIEADDDSALKEIRRPVASL